MKRLVVVVLAIVLFLMPVSVFARGSHGGHAGSHSSGHSSHSHYHSHQHYSHRRSAKSHKPGGRAGHSRSWCYDNQQKRHRCRNLKGATK
jgi:uncharacterized membrane protein